ncbi:HU family DNA-binding protein [Azonexus hydrophilus]|uniref:HU family DNA-binding protein n=1 Tax=Azonexus hydrophilus TaxID=418702 RepID=A0ABZ2XLQ6_9RHOO
MNKQELIAAIAEKTEVSQAVAGRVVACVLDTIVDTVSAGGEVAITGFGSFGVAERAAKEGRNPATGDKIKIPATKAPRFKAGKVFKDKVKGA